jgi:endonuclease III related protein
MMQKSRPATSRNKKNTSPAKRCVQLLAMHDAMLDAAGPRHWWPARGDFEMVVGAILTQNTAWKNVEKAIANLRRARALSPTAMRRISESDLAELIRPAGYFNQKTRYLKAFVGLLFSQHDGRLANLFALDVPEMRRALLAVKGIGRETADSIILYGARKPIFVVDAYTRRIISRHALMPENADYDALRAFFEDALPPDAPLYNEFHALIVWTGNRYCARTPHCEGCPIEKFPRRNS